MNATDCYVTPQWLVDRLGSFVTDPCSNPRAHVRALFRYMLETGHDGLRLPWFGRTWLNHPYSDPLPWIVKAHAELELGRCTELLCLPKHDHSTEWWQLLVDPSDDWIIDQWQFHKRINFDVPPELLAEMQRLHELKGKKGKPSTSNNSCSSLIHVRRADQARLSIADIATCWART